MRVHVKSRPAGEGLVSKAFREQLGITHQQRRYSDVGLVTSGDLIGPKRIIFIIALAGGHVGAIIHSQA